MEKIYAIRHTVCGGDSYQTGFSFENYNEFKAEVERDDQEGWVTFEQVSKEDYEAFCKENLNAHKTLSRGGIL